MLKLYSIVIDVEVAVFEVSHKAYPIKQEKIYLNPANGGLELYHNVREYVDFYNSIRRHTEIGKVPPDEIYFKKQMVG